MPDDLPNFGTATADLPDFGGDLPDFGEPPDIFERFYRGVTAHTPEPILKSAQATQEAGADVLAGFGKEFQHFAGTLPKGLARTVTVPSQLEYAPTFPGAGFGQPPANTTLLPTPNPPAEIPRTTESLNLRYLKQLREQDPIYHLGQVTTEAAEPTPEEQKSGWFKAGQYVGGAAPMALGPLAPAAFTLSSVGESVATDFDRIKAENPGIDDNDAADQALTLATEKGLITAATFEVLPKALRGPLEKYLVNKWGTTAFKNWLAGRVAAGTEGAALMGTQAVGERAAEGKAPSKEEAKAAAGGLLFNIIMPWRQGEFEAQGEPPTAPESPMTPLTPVQPVFTGKDEPTPAQTPRPGIVSVGDAFQKALDELSKRSGVPQEPVPEPAPSPKESAELERLRALPEGPEAEQAENERAIQQAVDNISTDNLDPQTAAGDLVRLVRRASKDETLKPALNLAFKKVGDTAREQGVSLDAIKQAIGDEMGAIYGADTAEMVEHYFGKAEKSAGALPDFGPAEPKAIEAPKAEQPPELPKPKGRRLFLRPRSDGVPDILDDIQELGGLKPPGKEDVGGEYDAWKESMTGPAKLLVNRSATHRPDTIIGELKALRPGAHERINSADDLYDAIRAAVSQRDHLRQTGGGAEAKLQRFWDAATNPKNKNGLVKINASDLKVGHKFRLKGPEISNDELEVTHIDPDTFEVTVKDGRKMGTQTLPDGTEIWVQRKYAPEGTTPEPPTALREEPAEFRLDQPESVEQQKAREAAELEAFKKKAQRAEIEKRAAAPLTGKRGDIGQGDLLGGGDLFSLRETATPANLDKLAQKVHGKSYAELEDWQQDAIRQALEATGKRTKELAKQYGVDPETINEGFQQSAQQPYQQGTLDFTTPPRQPAAERPLSEAQRRALSRDTLKGPFTDRPEHFRLSFEQGSVVSSIEPDQVPPGTPQLNIPKGALIQTPEDFIKYLIPLRSPYAESLKVVLLDANQRVIHSEVLYAGTLDTTLVDMRDIQRVIAKHPDAEGVLLSHNHPSGDVSPSDADLKLNQIFETGIKSSGLRFIDHIITNGERYFRSSTNSIHEIPSAVLADWETMPRSELMLLDTPSDFQRIAASLRKSDQHHAHIIYTNTRARVTAIERVSPTLGAAGKAVLRGIGREGAAGFLIDWGPTVDAGDAQHWSLLIHDRAAAGSTTGLHDYAHQDSLSAVASNTWRPMGRVGRAAYQETALHEEPARDWKELHTERESVTRDIADLNAEIDKAGGRRNASTDVKNKADAAIAKHKALTAQLRQKPEYVEDLLNQFNAATDDMTREGLKGELTMIEPDLLNKVYHDMQSRGIIPTSQKLPEPFSSLQNLTDWLKAHDIESPKRSFRERMGLARRSAEAYQTGKDALQRAFNRSVAFAKTAYELWKHPPIDDDFRSLVKDWNVFDEQTGLEGYRFQQEINRRVEDPRRRAALMVWIQAGGMQEAVEQQLSMVPERYKPIWEAATKLTADEKALANQIRADWAAKLDMGQNAGLVERGRQNYGPTVWKTAPQVTEGDSTFAIGGALETRKGTPGNPNARLDPRNPFFSFHKSTPTYFDGIMAGGVPETMDVGKLVAYYHQAFNKSLSSRAVIRAMLDAKAKDNKPVVILSGRADPMTTADGETKGYVVDSRFKGHEAQTDDGRPYESVDHFALKDWKFVLRTEEGKPILARADMLVHPDYVKFLRNVLQPSALRQYGVVRGALKFNRFLKESKFALSPFHLATLAEHALSHTVNPWTGNFKLDLNEPTQRALVRGGLDLGFSGERVDFQEGLSSHGGLWSKIPGIGDISVKFTDFLFKDYLPSIKMKMALEALERNTKRYGSKLTEEQIYDLTASQANAAFGSQNYRLLGRSPLVRDLLSLGFVAPDFLTSRMKFIGQAFQKHGAEQRRALFVMSAAMYVGARVLNALIDPDNDPHWGLKDAFSVVYKGRRYGLRTVMGDVWHAVSDPRSFWYNRISPITRTLVELGTHKDWRGVNRTAIEQMQDVASWIVPTSAEGLVPGATKRGTGIAESVGRSVGVMSRKDTPATRISDMARDYNRDSKDPAAVSWQKARDQETLPDSAYRDLDTLLEANNLKAAKAEYDRLVKEGHKPKAIAERYREFRPFTGTVARDKEFYNSLSGRDRKLYDRARAEHQAQYERLKRIAP